MLAKELPRVAPNFTTVEETSEIIDYANWLVDRQQYNRVHHNSRYLTSSIGSLLIQALPRGRLGAFSFEVDVNKLPYHMHVIRNRVDQQLTDRFDQVRTFGVNYYDIGPNSKQIRHRDKRPAGVIGLQGIGGVTMFDNKLGLNPVDIPIQSGEFIHPCVDQWHAGYSNDPDQVRMSAFFY